MSEQAAQLERVTKAIKNAILAFFAERVETGESKFYADDLRMYVETHLEDHPVAPGSPDRVMRHLRQHGELNYRVLSRPSSLYEVIA
jgi:uncharacterized membrane protein YvbJ